MRRARRRAPVCLRRLRRRARVHSARAPPLTLDVTPYLAQAGHRGAANVLARLTRHLRFEERIRRASSGKKRHLKLAARALESAIDAWRE